MTATRIDPSDIQRVMEVAGRLFAERGYDGVGIREIALESGVKMPSIFYHFASKASLYDEVLEYRYESSMAMVAKELKSIRGAAAKLDFILGQLFDSLINDRTLLLLLQRDFVHVAAAKDHSHAGKESSWFMALTRELFEKALEREVTNRTALSLVALLLGFCDITAAMSQGLPNKESRDAWHQEQRQELIAMGGRFCAA